MGLLPDDHVYSYSQLSSFDECSYGFYLQRIEGLQEQASNAFAERGTLVHDLLDQWAKKIITKEEMLVDYERRYPEEVVTAFPRVLAAKGYAKKAYQQGIDFLTNFDEFEGYEVIEDKMYRQQLLYATYVKEHYGKYPDAMMFHLFNESGVKMQRLFSMDQYNETLDWATKQIAGIEGYTVIDWLTCKEKPDFYCWEICSSRKVCPNGVMPTFRNKKKDEYEGYKEGE